MPPADDTLDPSKSFQALILALQSATIWLFPDRCLSFSSCFRMTRRALPILGVPVRASDPARPNASGRDDHYPAA